MDDEIKNATNTTPNLMERIQPPLFLPSFFLNAVTAPRFWSIGTVRDRNVPRGCGTTAPDVVGVEKKFPPHSLPNSRADLTTQLAHTFNRTLSTPIQTNYRDQHPSMPSWISKTVFYKYNKGGGKLQKQRRAGISNWGLKLFRSIQKNYLESTSQNSAWPLTSIVWYAKHSPTIYLDKVHASPNDNSTIDHLALHPRQRKQPNDNHLSFKLSKLASICCPFFEHIGRLTFNGGRELEFLI